MIVLCINTALSPETAICFHPSNSTHLLLALVKIYISLFAFYITILSIVPPYYHLTNQKSYFIMCYQVVERYAVCRCLYHRHAIDPCQSYGQRHHHVQEKTVLVGYACPRHSTRRTGEHGSSQNVQPFPDSGYSSGGTAFRPTSDYRR